MRHFAKPTQPVASVCGNNGRASRWADRRRTLPLHSESLYDRRASAAIPKIKVNRVYILRHVTSGEAEDWKRGDLHLFLVGGDEFFHRVPVVDRDCERNNGDEDCRSSETRSSQGSPVWWHASEIRVRSSSGAKYHIGDSNRVLRRSAQEVRAAWVPRISNSFN